MKKIQTETQAKDAAKVTALVTKLNRYRHEYYNMSAPSVSVADLPAYESNLLLILRFQHKEGKKLHICNQIKQIYYIRDLLHYLDPNERFNKMTL